MKDRSKISTLWEKLEERFFNKTYQSRRRTKIRGNKLRDKKKRFKSTWIHRDQ